MSKKITIAFGIDVDALVAGRVPTAVKTLLATSPEAFSLVK